MQSRERQQNENYSGENEREELLRQQIAENTSFPFRRESASFRLTEITLIVRDLI